MTKQELEIKCEILEERLNRINELCKEYTDKGKAAETIGAIMANSDPDFLEKCISWRQ